MKKEEPNCDKELRILRHVLSEFRKLNEYVHGSAVDTFNHFLAFTVNGFTLGGEGLKWWKYSKEQTSRFLEFFQTWTKSLSEMLQLRPWYDFLGEIYEDEVASKNHKSFTGQFFTPHQICELMAAITMSSNEKRDFIGDPCCGSGRLLLAAYAVNPAVVVQAQDLDRTCVMMTVCNFIAHGVHGKVIWGDSLKNEEFEAYLVNPELGNPSSPLCLVPHCIKCEPVKTPPPPLAVSESVPSATPVGQ